MTYTLGQAARTAGVSKPTIQRAIKSGRLSAVRKDDGTYAIEQVELHRAFPLTVTGDGLMKQTVTPGDTGDGTEQRDRLIQEQAETIRDLRARLDQADAERRSVQVQLTSLLTDGRAPTPSARRAWWRWRR